MLDTNFWTNKKVLVTGHTGFKGSWLSLVLSKLGARVVGYALDSQFDSGLYVQAEVRENLLSSEIADIRDFDKLYCYIKKHKPDIAFHLAAQPLVIESYENPVETHQINIIGTVNFLEALRKVGSVSTIINVTTDKCYRNVDWCWPYRETDQLGGSDPYSSSKSASEMVTSSYYKSYFEQSSIGVATARAGNVIGGGDWAANRLIPDFIRAYQKKTSLRIRNPKSIRPWQHVLEPIYAYLLLAQELSISPASISGAWNIGPKVENDKSVEWVLNYANKILKNQVEITVDNESNWQEASTLKLDCSKAFMNLNWKQNWLLEKSINETIEWYEAFLSNKNMNDYSCEQIAHYFNKIE